MTTTIVIVFFLVYLGMILGGLPFLQLDRTGVALLGAIALIGVGAVSPEEAARAVHLPTVILLFSFMVVSAQLRLGGFYPWVTLRLADSALSPLALLGGVITVVAALSAVFSNDIVCLSIAPVLADACVRRRLNPVPFLLALACAANVGSAATLIGNPQNMLIGSALRLSFAGYAAEAALPVVLGLFATWAIIGWHSRGRWELSTDLPNVGEPRENEGALINRWQSAKGLIVAGALLLIFLFTPWPREVAALTGAGLLLMSRRLHSNKMLGLVDWELLVLFAGLFVVNHAFQQTGLTAAAVADLAARGVHLEHPGPLFVATLILSNTVSNVPAVMMLLPVANHSLAGPLLALVSTLAGNLFIVGSIANIIVVDAAARRGIAIDWRTHARVGVPVTVVTLSILAAYLAVRM
ncbi:MAG: anion transporter [Vicinamibacteria bacterium]|nr:anion transporter [Vicinamibacteria bacterium]